MIRLFAALLLTLGLTGPLAAQTTEDAPTITAMVEGAADAPVTLIEYASYTCGHCRNFHAGQYQKIKEAYIDTGKLRFEFREIYFDRPGLWASMVARCGGQMRYNGIKDLLFSKQRDWLGDGQPAGIAERLRTIGKTAGLTDDQLDACMTDAATAQALVDWSTANSKADKVDATPTLIINGTKHSNSSYAEIAKLLDAALAKAQ